MQRESGHLIRDEGGTLAELGDIRGFGDDLIEMRVGGVEIKAVEDAGDAFQFDATGADGARLQAVEGIGRVGGKDVVLGDVEQRGGEKRVGGFGLIFGSRFVLFAFGGQEGRTEEVHAGGRQEGSGVAEVRSEAEGGEIGDAGTTSEGAGALITGCIAQELTGGEVSPIFAAAEGGDEVVSQNDMVLNVEAGLFGWLISV
jgi:hypothetical protein